jgi:ATP-dependent RNA helicase DeaD
MENPFKELGLVDELVNAVTDLNYERPSEVQEKAIPLLLENEGDLVALAQTGTGKTAAFGLPLLQLIDVNSRKTQAVILSPTRELAIQISDDLKKFSKNLKGLNVVTVYGGASISDQARLLRKGAQVIVATPGRIKDMIRRNFVQLEDVEYVVLDEADEMLNMGFKEDIDSILSHTPDTKNTWLFSATMPKEVAQISSNYMSNPEEITCGRKNEGASTVEHVYFTVKGYNKYSALRRLIDFEPEMFAIIFCRTRSETQEVAEKLIAGGYNAGALHGDLSQKQRDVVMNLYRKRSLQFLVATDVAARGIDVSNVSHVINYQLPDDIEAYTHRSGRTGRAGNEGHSFCIITPRERYRVRQIEKIINKKFTEGKLPSGDEVCEKQLFSIIHKIQNVELDNEAVNKYMDKVYEAFEGMDKEVVLKQLISLELQKFADEYKNSDDLNELGGSSGGNGKTKRIFINIGTRDDVDWTALKDYIRSITGLEKDAINGVDVKNKFSFFNVKPELADKLLEDFKSQRYQGRKVVLQLSTDPGGSGGGGDRRRRKSFGGGRKREGSFSGNRREGGSPRRSSSGGGRFDRRSSGPDRSKSSGSGPRRRG